MPTSWDTIEGPCGHLAVHLAGAASASVVPANLLVLCHGFPGGPDAADHLGTSLATLADRLASETGWHVLVGCLRGVGASSGDFSLAGWLEDLRRLVDRGAELAGGSGVWVVGFGTGGALALCVAADDDRVRGVACMGSPATFAAWSGDVRDMVDYARRVGVIKLPGFPPDWRAWGAAFSALRPDQAAGQLPPRPLLVVHGADDTEVPVAQGRALADAAGRGAEFHVLAGAGHRLRADPRAVALLAGWLERQGP